ncbi:MULTISPECIES: gephyrin-like molybdotransferase Glp [Sporomusa]|jgi:molybdopterin molybdotransferase|uniref:molybdopterin molybdotransferase MoeA n=1 Tax=Sporomusa TaxID=2375 RepID=UPI00202F2D4A|nr:gephyrin-like molybdotransferase Glp [Sporomusa sphaeroides]MCM0758252.1 molybdopterin molybdotransferase MoeA [Sporomusa sphaeroides DSM 2875]
MEFFDCISLAKAQTLINNVLPECTTAVEETELIEALGRIVAEDIAAADHLPPFNRSTVDGYAVLSRDTFSAGEGAPVMLDIIGEVFMGQSADYTIVSGQAVIVPTGGMLPAGADGVVMLEHAEQSDQETLLVVKPIAPGENMVAKGEDIKPGTVFVAAGTRLTAAEIGALAACGIARVKVRRRLTVGIISTGDEVVDVIAVPENGQVRDINSYTLAAMLTAADCQVTRYGITKDNYADLLAAIGKAAGENQLVLVSGGSSVGARDHTVQVIEELGRNKVIFHGLAVRPGKPTIFGLIDHVPVFGLPGHPVAAMTICQMVVMPLVSRLQGSGSCKAGWRIPARLTRNCASAPGRDDFLRVKLIWQAGEYRAEPVLGKSGLISVMTQADGVVHVPADSSGLYAGDVVLVEVMREA